MTTVLPPFYDAMKSTIFDPSEIKVAASNTHSAKIFSFGRV